MIKEFIEKWDKYKNDLEDYFRYTEQIEYDEYEKIVKILFEKIINKDLKYDSERFDVEDLLKIDDGDYQGTQIFILHKGCYQPEVEEYVYTSTYYGSCSGCDTIKSISSYDRGLPDEEQVKDYMTLALHLLQKCHYMQGE